MTILWPVSLPPPLRRDYRRQPMSAAVVTEFPAWPIARPVQSDKPTRIDLSFAFTPEHQATFDAWFSYDLAEGTRDFLLPIVRASGTFEARIVNFLGQPPIPATRGALNDTYSGSVITRSGTQMDRNTWDAINGAGGLDAYNELMLAAALAVNQPNED